MTHRPAPFAVVGVLACMIVAAPAFAQPDTDAPSVTVRLSDVNFNTLHGARTALGRIETAADAVCGGEPGALEFHRRSLFALCRANAVRGAVERLDRPMLSQLVPQARPALDRLASR